MHECKSCRVQRLPPEVAQRFDEVPRLTAKQREALDLLEAVMEEPGMALEFDLRPGDMLIALVPPDSPA